MPKLDKETLQILRSSLPTNGVKLIIERLGEYTIDHINKVLRGTINNDAIIEAAIQVAKEEKDKKDALKNEILEIASK